MPGRAVRSFATTRGRARFMKLAPTPMRNSLAPSPRNALISLVAGGLMLLCHLRWRDGAGARWLWAALVALAAGLCAGEATLGAGAYLVAWQLTLDPAPRRQRWLGIAPYALLVLLWRALYDHLGYGVSGSDLYLDPGREPLTFSLATLARWPVLQLGQWLQVPVDLVMALPPNGQLTVLVAGVVTCAGLLWLFGELLRSSAVARFWALGMALALVPLCAAFPMDRLLIFAGIGAFGLLALQVERWGWLGTKAVLVPSRARRALVVGLLVLHLPLAALMLSARTVGMSGFGLFFSAGANTAPAELAVTEQSFFFVTGHEFPTAYLPMIRAVEGRPSPRRVALLASITADKRITREDDRTLVIEPDLGFLAVVLDRLERRRTTPFEIGQRVSMPDFTAEIRSVTEDGRPKAVAFRFKAPLEDPRYRWLAWGPSGAEPFDLPMVGATVVVPEQPFAALVQEPRPR